MHADVWAKYKLYYLDNWTYHVLLVFLSIVSINHIFLNGYYNHSFKHNAIITSIVAVAIHRTIGTLLLWQLWEYYNYVWCCKWICNTVLTDNIS